MWLEFPFRCRPLSKRGDEARLLWALGGPGDPEDKTEMVVPHGAEDERLEITTPSAPPGVPRTEYPSLWEKRCPLVPLAWSRGHLALS